MACPRGMHACLNDLEALCAVSFCKGHLGRSPGDGKVILLLLPSGLPVWQELIH